MFKEKGAKKVKFLITLLCDHHVRISVFTYLLSFMTQVQQTKILSKVGDTKENDLEMKNNLLNTIVIYQQLLLKLNDIYLGKFKR